VTGRCELARACKYKGGSHTAAMPVSLQGMTVFCQPWESNGPLTSTHHQGLAKLVSLRSGFSGAFARPPVSGKIQQPGQIRAPMEECQKAHDTRGVLSHKAAGRPCGRSEPGHDFVDCFPVV
jgi:hypothetical protein